MRWPDRIIQRSRMAAWVLATATVCLVGALPARALIIDLQYNAEQSQAPAFDPTGQLLHAIVAEAAGLGRDRGPHQQSLAVSIEQHFDLLK